MPSPSSSSSSSPSPYSTPHPALIPPHFLPFDRRLDFALLHCLSDEDQDAYVSGLTPLVKPGGKLLLGSFSDMNPDPWLNPRRLTEGRLRALFCEERGWVVEELRPSFIMRPAERGSKGGAWTFSHWMVARKLGR